MLGDSRFIIQRNDGWRVICLYRTRAQARHGRAPRTSLNPAQPTNPPVVSPMAPTECCPLSQLSPLIGPQRVLLDA